MPIQLNRICLSIRAIVLLQAASPSSEFRPQTGQRRPALRPAREDHVAKCRSTFVIVRVVCSLDRWIFLGVDHVVPILRFVDGSSSMTIRHDHHARGHGFRNGLQYVVDKLRVP